MQVLTWCVIGVSLAVREMERKFSIKAWKVSLPTQCLD